MILINSFLIKSLIDMAVNISGTALVTARALEEQSVAEESLVCDAKENKTITANDYYYGNRAKEIANGHLIMPQNLMEEIEMSYEGYVVYLLSKYGPAQCDYFYSKACTTRNKKIDRANEGLICHHLAEECGLQIEQITKSDFAKNKPYDFYRAHNFVYCDYIEHLLLHVKIALDDIHDDGMRDGLGIDIVGAVKIIRELNAFYAQRDLPLIKLKQLAHVKDRYEDYIVIVRFLANVIKHQNLTAWCQLEDLIEDHNGVSVEKIRYDVFRGEI